MEHTSTGAVLEYEVKRDLEGRSTVEIHDAMRGQDQSAFLDLGVRAMEKRIREVSSWFESFSRVVEVVACLTLDQRR